ncbi:dihydrodipicolinate synthase family protein [Actinomycetospora lutea]|uniref:dihydrodipicolinate synthase family protein n=1 Tax=Actinomycetospora lutea TaxID=663604 RepID=UPI0023668758|nr:dihydrodipicolinate synthase family protein [Actinomycetospora lutea]MDD7942757.1 dihydrodipicolinate synthase family protein [Actinomycetospora lutea]
MAEPVFTGVGVALVTLFDDARQVDHDGTGKLAAQLVELGATAIVVAGTTGEADALDDAERLALFASVRAAVPDAVVVGGTGSSSAHQTARLTASARDTGVDAVIARTPRGRGDPRARQRQAGALRGAGDAAAQRALAAAHVSEQDFPCGVKHLVARRFGTSEIVRMG